MIFEIIFTVLIIFIIVDYFKKTKTNKILKANGVIGPKLTLPLLGDTLITIGINAKNIMQFFENLQLKYGKVNRFWCFNKCLLFVQDAKYVESILGSPTLLKKSFFYDQLSLWLGDGLVMSSGIKWHKRRKILNPAFHVKALEQFVEVFQRQAYIMAEKLRQQANGLNSIDITAVVCSTTLDILLETAMGVKFNDDSLDGLKYIEALNSLSQIAAERLFNPLMHNNITFKLFFYKSYRRFNKNIQILHNFTENIIKRRQLELKKSIENGNEVNETECDQMGLREYRTTLLDYLLQSKIDEKFLTNKDIRDEVDTFTFGGHDTVNCAISFILYLISRHPKEQQKVYDEIVQIMGSNKNEPIHIKHLQDLKYLDCVIKEALRLYPPAPIIARKTEKDYKFGDKIIPRNTNIILLIYAIFRDPDYFPGPNNFIPERFSLFNKENYTSAFLPFSAGPRSCIGQKYAILEIKTIVSIIVRNFELIPMEPDVHTIIKLVMRSTTGVHMGLKPRA